MDEYVTISGKRFKKGYTTGTCAAAASKAAVSMIVSGRVIDRVRIDTPAGKTLVLPICGAVMKAGIAQCAVIKDGGDDPDVTTGLKVFARAELTNDGNIAVKAGEGIGTVTLPGLKVPVGSPAINPVPMKMITKAVSSVLPNGKGAVITLWVPGGEEVAKKTFNPKLGIVGGISIIGTKGIVEPMSEDAWKESLALELSILVNKGMQSCVFVFGNYGQDFSESTLGIPKKRIIKISNFLGFMLEKATEYGIENILLAGHLGKLVKVAAGIFHTHSRVADARMETLAAYAGLEGATTAVIRKIFSCKTTGEVVSVLDAEGLEKVYHRIAKRASNKCMEYTDGKIQVGTVLFYDNNRLLYRNKAAEKMMGELKQ